MHNVHYVNSLRPNDAFVHRHQAITWSNDGILLIVPLGTNLSEIFIKIHAFSFKKVHLNTSSVKRRPFCLCLNVLIQSEILMCIPEIVSM